MDLLSEKVVAKQMDMSLAVLRKWRHKKQGPPYRKLGSAVRYERKDVEAWVMARTRGAS